MICFFLLLLNDHTHHVSSTTQVALVMLREMLK